MRAQPGYIWTPVCTAGGGTTSPSSPATPSRCRPPATTPSSTGGSTRPSGTSKTLVKWEVTVIFWDCRSWKKLAARSECFLPEMNCSFISGRRNGQITIRAVDRHLFISKKCKNREYCHIKVLYVYFLPAYLNLKFLRKSYNSYSYSCLYIYYISLLRRCIESR